LPTLFGNCNEAYEKWSYDVKTGTCKQFTYSGCNGNLNQFDTKQACEYTCQGLKPFDKEIPTAICHEPKVTGTCSEKIQRWYFNQTTQMCDQFTFTGCNEVGANNFEDEYSCRSVCNADEINPCVLPSDIGSGDNYQLFYYYNRDKKYCQGFYYGGFDGNANRFKTIDDCEMVCVLSKEEQKYLSRLPQRCIYPSDKGNDCTQITTQYHFEAKTNECYAYDYSGCGLAYSNRFETSEECIGTCNITQFLKNTSLTENDLIECNFQ
jgi:papilin